MPPLPLRPGASLSRVNMGPSALSVENCRESVVGGCALRECGFAFRRNGQGLHTPTRPPPGPSRWSLPHASGDSPDRCCASRRLQCGRAWGRRSLGASPVSSI
eukprot:scaffold1240_cov101-Isochrysis_galbana.AAC.22